MHGDWCPSASAVSGRLVEPGEEAAHKSQSIFCYSAWILFQATPVKKCVHGHCTHNLLLLRSPQFSVRLGPRSSCGHKSLLAICVFLAYKQSVGVRGMNNPPEWVTPRSLIPNEKLTYGRVKWPPHPPPQIVPAKIVTAVNGYWCMTLDRRHHRSIRCWCTSINLLSGTAASLSQLYNREGVRLWSFSHWHSFPGCMIWAVLWLTAGRTLATPQWKLWLWDTDTLPNHDFWEEKQTKTNENIS